MNELTEEQKAFYRRLSKSGRVPISRILEKTGWDIQKLRESLGQLCTAGLCCIEAFGEIYAITDQSGFDREISELELRLSDLKKAKEEHQRKQDEIENHPTTQKLKQEFGAKRV